jgi:transcription elongation factor Elf1
MGRGKKAVKKVVKKKRPNLSKVFKCFFCSSDKSVECKIDLRKSRTGVLQCNVCHAKFERPVHELSQPIDLYHQWLDETAAAQEKESSRYVSGGAPPASSSTFDESDGEDEEDD